MNEDVIGWRTDPLQKIETRSTIIIDTHSFIKFLSFTFPFVWKRRAQGTHVKEKTSVYFFTSHPRPHVPQQPLPSIQNEKKKKKGNPICLSAKNSSGTSCVHVCRVCSSSSGLAIDLLFTLYTQTERHSRFIHSLCLSPCFRNKLEKTRGWMRERVRKE